MADGDESNVVAPEVVEEAKRYGWQEQEKFKGDPKSWVDAATYVQRGRESIPVLRNKVTSLESRYSSAQTTITQLQKDVAMMRKIGYSQAEREWKERFEALKADKIKAVENADAGKIVEIDEQISDHKQAKPVEPKAPQGDGAMPPELSKWFEENPWYLSNPKLKARANGIGQALAETGLQGLELLNAIREQMVELFPSDMGVEQPAGMTHGATRRASAGADHKAARSYDNLPADAKAACDRLVRQKQATREEYVANYEWDE